MDVLKLINIKSDDLFSAIVKSPTLSSKALLKWAKNRYKVFPVSHLGTLWFHFALKRNTNVYNVHVIVVLVR